MLGFLFAALVMIIAIFVAIAIILGGIGVLITMLYIEIIKPVFTFPKKVAHSIGRTTTNVLVKPFIYIWRYNPTIVNKLIQAGVVIYKAITLPIFLITFMVEVFILFLPLIYFWLNLLITMYLVITTPFSHGFVERFNRADDWISDQIYWNTGKDLHPFIVDDIVKFIFDRKKGGM